MSMDHPMIEQLAPVGHPSAFTAIVLAWLGVLTPFLTVLSTLAGFLWFLVCIYESRTFQHWKRNWQMKRKAKKIAKIKAKLKVQTAELEALEDVRVARVMAREKVASAKAEATDLIIHEAAEAEIKAPPV